MTDQEIKQFIIDFSNKINPNTKSMDFNNLCRTVADITEKFILKAFNDYKILDYYPNKVEGLIWILSDNEYFKLLILAALLNWKAFFEQLATKLIEDVSLYCVKDGEKFKKYLGKLTIQDIKQCVKILSNYLPGNINTLIKKYIDIPVDQTKFETISNKLVTYKGNESNVVIPLEITSIGNNAFYNCKTLESIAIPNSILEIGSGAFFGCENLKDVKLPKSIKRIPSNAFNGCALESITIPVNIEVIEDYAFCDCTNLKEVIFELPSGLEIIKDYAFAGCTSLEEITLPGDNLDRLDDSVFEGCTNLEYVGLDGVKYLGDNIFRDCSSTLTVERFQDEYNVIRDYCEDNGVKCISYWD